MKKKRGGFYIRSMKKTIRLRFAVRIFRSTMADTIFPSRRFLKGKNKRIAIFRIVSFIRVEDYLTCRVVAKDIKDDCKHLMRATYPDVQCRDAY